MKTAIRIRRPLGAALLLLPLGAAAAETPSTTPANEESVVLSPFVVTSEAEKGYVITATTSGTRVRTDIRDVGAQIDVLSAEFLADVAANRPEEAALYSLNIENEQDDPSKYGSGNQNNFERQVPGVSARGFGQAHGSGATRSREFFETIVPTHGYNTNTLAFASGPNAILFGLGQPGGALTTSLNRAQLQRDTGTVKLRGDNFGSLSGSVDLNKVLWRDRLALRFATLEDRTKLFLEPNYANDTRYYGALIFRPHRKIELRLHTEKVRGRDTPAQYRLPKDEGSTWDPAVDRLHSDSLPASQRPLSQAHNTGQKPVLVFANNLQLDPRIPIVARNVNRNAPGLVDLVEARDPNFVGALDDFPYTLSPSTLDRLALLYDHVNLWGNTLVRTVNATLHNAFLEANPVRDLFFELGFNQEKFDGRQSAYGRSARYNFARDIDAELPNGAPNPYAGQFFVGDEVWGWESRNEEREGRITANYQFDFEVRRPGDAPWLAQLGRHNLSLMYSDRKSIAIRQRAWRTWLQNTDGTTPSFIAPAAARPPTGNEDPRKTWLNRNTRGVAMMQYVDPYSSEPYLRVIPGWDPVATFWTMPDPGRPGSTAQAAMFEPQSGGGTEAENFNRRIRGQMLAYQGSLWKQRLTFTYGWRRDEVDVRNLVGSGDTIQSFSREAVAAGNIPKWVVPGGNFPWWTTLGWGDVNSTYTYSNDTKGVVFRPTGLFGNRFNWLSISYNESTNNSVGALKLNVTNEPLPPVTGVGRDYGFRIDLLGGRAAFRANWFETAAQNTDGSAVSFGLRNNLHALEDRFGQLNPNTYSPDGWNPMRTSVQQFQTNADVEARGVEFSLAASPTRNWNIRLAAGKNRSTQTNVGRDWIRWAQNRTTAWERAQWFEPDLSGRYLPVVGWKPDVNGRAPTNAELIAEGYTRLDPATGQPQRLPNGTIVTYRTKLGAPGQTPISGWQNIAFDEQNFADPTTMKQFFDRDVVANSIQPIEQLDGQQNPNVRRWRANLTTTYQFTEGRLRGVGVGGSARFRDKAIVGFAGKTLNAGTPNETIVSDVTRPYYNDAELFFDAMLSYRGRAKWWGLGYKVQLNVRNVLDEIGPYPVQSDSRGIGRVWALYEPRTWILSCQFDF